MVGESLLIWEAGMQACVDYQLAGGSKLRKPVSDVGHFKASFATVRVERP